MAEKIKWQRSDEGYVDSHCGRFWMCPEFEGTTRAQSYHLYELNVMTLQGESRGTHDTQRDAKAHAQDLADGRPAKLRSKR